MEKVENKHRQNGFDLIRHAAAIAVIFGHAYPLTARASPGYLVNTVQTLAVKVFFVTSGFLISRSWCSDPDPKRYLVKRCLRILPGLFAAVLLTALVLGPAFTDLSIPAYFKNVNTWRYLENCALYPMYNLPGLFAKNPYPMAVNGSLWTIPVEFFMYLITPVILGRKGDLSKLAVLIATGLSITTAVLVSTAGQGALLPKVVYGTPVASAVEVGVYFQIGSLYAVWNLDRLSRPILSVILFAIPMLLIYGPQSGELLLMLLLPFMVISVGKLHLPFADRILRGQDLSYGLYLYGFPVEQAVQALFHNRFGPHKTFLAASIIAICLAFLSWNFIERYALARKPKRVRQPDPVLA